MNFLNKEPNFYYRIPSQLSTEQIDLLIRDIEQYFPGDTELGKVSANRTGTVDDKVRKTKIKWIYKDCWIAGVLANMVICANNDTPGFNFDLTGWGEALQYTVYDEVGSHYKWHVDQTDSSEGDQGNRSIRKLSITLLLSDPNQFEGGEFQLHNGVKSEIVNLRQGEAIVFPSTIPHRVKPIKSGVRRSLVGWYHGPPWR